MLFASVQKFTEVIFLKCHPCKKKKKFKMFAFSQYLNYVCNKTIGFNSIIVLHCIFLYASFMIIQLFHIIAFQE